ncbi:RTA1 like protein-domain-containing protein [Blakeslea trispora]|nr:RTA1 like protein-domain-containing protein [Blakeslea trispora]
MKLLSNGLPASSIYFKYSPNIPLCYVGIVLFFLFFLALAARTFYSKFSYQILLILTFVALLETLGFVLRIVCAEDPNTGLFIAMSIMLLVTPNIIISVNYKLVGRFIVASGVETRFRIIGPEFYKTFSTSNVIATILQSVGSGIQSGSQGNNNKTLAIVSILIQIACFTAFLICTIYVNNCDDYKYYDDAQSSQIRKTMRIIYVTTGLLYIRLIYRLISYILVNIEGQQVYEWPFYAFDALMLALCLLAYCFFSLEKYICQDVNSTDTAGNLNRNKV